VFHIQFELNRSAFPSTDGRTDGHESNIFVVFWFLNASKSISRNVTDLYVCIHFCFRRGKGRVFCFAIASRRDLGPTQPPVNSRSSFPVHKRPGREADHSPPSSVELYLHSPNTPSWRGAQLKQRYNFTFYLNLERFQTSIYICICYCIVARIKCLGMFTLYLLTKCYIPTSNGPLVTIIKWEA